MSETPGDELIKAVDTLLPALLQGMDAVSFIARHMHPPLLESLVEQMEPVAAKLKQARPAFDAAEWPKHLSAFAAHVREAADETEAVFQGLREAVGDQSSPGGPIFAAYRGMRHGPRAMEALYPVSAMLPPVNRFFLDDSARDNEALVEELAQGVGKEGTGIHHFGNERKQRGGFSLYVPETYDATRPHPLIVACHGGSGHGRGFLWTWLTAARSRGAILLSPTSLDTTWSLMEPEQDRASLARMIAHVNERWNIDATHVLLTGMSDGGTFTYLAGLAGGPYTHLAPVSSAWHPMLIGSADPARLNGLPVYITHGALDWMFAADMARLASSELSAAGAEVTYREIADLSHTYPAEENARIMDWFLG
ncbi:phospholipase [Parvibaculum sp.]|jgi:phospholipase/carboxylesterase|uniref:phospholipase n=1 Tax=Parvibaculum sp. TaxID=2024848 RepID=UPI000C54DC62|nr:phospholipase [Parvibaculum sp.]MAM95237.1 phospholipase [Parvibaculum sp.]HCX67142.1 phospholipase [Rhodobiaceae bacterium]|tara:strand:- start:3274 stop:4371 length:1098 start_codon:yes stop_codon:yes gene_type:complete